MFYEILDIVVVGSLMGIMASIIFEKNLFPLKTSAVLGIVGATTSFLLLEMFSMTSGIFQLGISTLIFLFGINMLGRVKIQPALEKSQETILSFKKETERSK